MFIQLLASILTGIIAGTFTGLIPGIHVNLIAVLLLTSSAYLLGFLTVEMLLAFIVSMAVTHTFMSSIPSIFLGAPDSSHALSVLPGHKLLLEGKGLEAVKLTIIGSLLGLFFAFATYPLLEKALDYGYPVISNYIGELLAIIAIFLVARSGKPLIGLIVLLLSGGLGLMALNARMENALFPLLTGLFGLSTLIFGLKQNSVLPAQEKTKETLIEGKQGFLSVLLGTTSGFITAVLPGLGSSTAATISSLVRKENDARNFLLMIGAISTVNFFMSIAALNVLGKARNGAIITVMTLADSPSTLLLLTSAMISGGIAVIVSLKASQYFLLFVEKINYVLLVKTVILCLVFLTFLLSGFHGIVVLIIATMIGLYANHKGIPRNVMMACIMVPVMTYFLL